MEATPVPVNPRSTVRTGCLFSHFEELIEEHHNIAKCKMGSSCGRPSLHIQVVLVCAQVVRAKVESHPDSWDADIVSVVVVIVVVVVDVTVVVSGRRATLPEKAPRSPSARPGPGDGCSRGQAVSASPPWCRLIPCSHGYTPSAPPNAVIVVVVVVV